MQDARRRRNSRTTRTNQLRNSPSPQHRNLGHSQPQPRRARFSGPSQHPKPVKPAHEATKQPVSQRKPRRAKPKPTTKTTIGKCYSSSPPRKHPRLVPPPTTGQNNLLLRSLTPASFQLKSYLTPCLFWPCRAGSSVRIPHGRRHHPHASKWPPRDRRPVQTHRLAAPNSKSRPTNPPSPSAAAANPPNAPSAMAPTNPAASSPMKRQRHPQ